jgi:hypothetical protein
MFIEDRNLLDKEEQEYIENIILGNDFNYHFHDGQVKNGHRFYFSHTLVCRHTQNIMSPHANFFINILKKFCNKHNLPLNKIFRANINLTTYINDFLYKPEIHLDHEFKHNQLIIYLNDSDGDTIVFDEKAKDVVLSIRPEKYKSVCFNSVPHTALSPSKGGRVILVITFI